MEAGEARRENIREDLLATMLDRTWRSVVDKIGAYGGGWTYRFLVRLLEEIESRDARIVALEAEVQRLRGG